MAMQQLDGGTVPCHLASASLIQRAKPLRPLPFDPALFVQLTLNSVQLLVSALCPMGFPQQVIQDITPSSRPATFIHYDWAIARRIVVD